MSNNSAEELNWLLYCWFALSSIH